MSCGLSTLYFDPQAPELAPEHLRANMTQRAQEGVRCPGQAGLLPLSTWQVATYPFFLLHVTLPVGVRRGTGFM